MGAPSQQQIDDAIAAGLARGEDEDSILAEVASLTRLSDEELAAMGIFPACEAEAAGPQSDSLSPSLSPSAAAAPPTEIPRIRREWGQR